MRHALLALALAVAACGSDAGSSVDLGADLSAPIPDISIRRPDLGPCPPPGDGACNSGDYCYGFENYCFCTVASHTLRCCEDDGQVLPCPATPPPDNDCCFVYHPVCSYACSGGVATMCKCTQDGWQCTTMPCD